MSDVSDMQLLREYARKGDEASFRILVDRHASLVYSAALRQVQSDDLARDVAQAVFTDLASKASQLIQKPSLSLTGWLYRGTRYIALNQVRADQRRRERERKAMEQFDSDPGAPDDWRHIAPMLEEAMSDLRDEDREALLLRFFKKLEFQAVGNAMGISSDAAQKRVSRALEKLRCIFLKRGFSTGTAALAGLLLARTVQAAPTGLAASIANSILSSTGTAAAAATIKTITMTALQKTLISTALATAVGVGIYEIHQNALMRDRVRFLEQQQAPLTEQLRKLQQEKAEAMDRLAALQPAGDASASNRNMTELMQLRAEAARLRRQNSQTTGVSTNASDPFTREVLTLTAKAAELNRILQNMPEKKIPELRFLTENDWLTAAREARLDTDSNIRMALSHLRGLAKTRMPMGGAISSYLAENNGQLPTDPLQLKSALKLQIPSYDAAQDNAILEAILKRYKIVHTGSVSDLPADAWILSEIAPVDPDYDSKARYAKGRSSVSNIGLGETPDPGD